MWHYWETTLSFLLYCLFLVVLFIFTKIVFLHSTDTPLNMDSYAGNVLCVVDASLAIWAFLPRKVGR